ncbi:MAG TPA: nucleotide sugar dehydrogenase [Verrucomicrobiaceae bacterium]|jgi:UDPglucose 6-dehydrogenase
MIAFAGLSHLGIVYSIATASRGHDVVAFDPPVRDTRALENGMLPVTEPGLPELFRSSQSRIRFTTDVSQISQCHLVFFSLDVATDAENRADLIPLRSLMDLVWPHLAPDAIIVILCQVPPGFTRPISGRRPPGTVFYQVETLIFGRAVERALQPERFIIGAADPDAPPPPAYAKWLESFPCPVLRMRYESAELAKIAINLFLVSSVTTANTLAEVCEKIGADWGEIAPALRLDRRIGPHAYLSPGLGIAGGNLERDLVAVQSLASEHGTEAGVIGAWQSNSRHRRDWVLRKIHELVLVKTEDPRLAIWGLAYKQDTHSVKNSPSLALARALAPFRKTAYDPEVSNLDPPVPNLTVAKSALDACLDADALVIMTPWRVFSGVSPENLRQKMKGDIVIDPFGTLDAAACRAAKLSHHRLGC